MREFPRLKYGGAHLKDPATELVPDVLRRTLAGAGLAVVLWIVLTTLVAAWLAQRRDRDFGTMLSAILRGRTEVPWRPMLITAGVLLLAAGPVVVLSGYYHVLGTDKVGQDVLYQTLKSMRTGLVIGTLTTLVMLPFALLLGIMAGYFRGWVDDVIQYVYTTLNSIPGVLLIAASVLLIQVWMDRMPDMFETVTERADAAPAVPVPDSGHHELDRAVPAAAGRGAQAARDGLRAGGAAPSACRTGASSRAIFCPTSCTSC